MTSNVEEPSAGERETRTKGAFPDLLRLLRPLRMSHFLPLNDVAFPSPKRYRIPTWHELDGL